ncbi:MAG: c-type cytochrome [Planctomycetia bacterium]|nr:c-type cytochrome [Planctomycetia bacterium]
MNRALGILVVLCMALAACARAEEPAGKRPLLPRQPLEELLKPVAAKEPADALKTFETIPGFRMELVAHEPDVVDPVAAAFDEDGRLYVAEMRDYPFRPKEDEKPFGRVRLLEDTDGDGRFDRSTVFADELLWPTGVVPWKQGVFVAAAPNIYYLKDTDHDGRADVRQIVFCGFGTQNEQGSVNNLAWALDGRIYASTSKNGGKIRPADDPQAEEAAINGRDFSFDPETGRFELVTGGGQFGNAFDDWGNRFLCDQSDPSMQVVLPHRYLARNPFLAVPKAINDLTPGATPTFRASPLEGWRIVRSSRRLALGERSEKSSGLSHNVLDGVAGLMIYRGQAFPPEFRGSLVVGDAQSNLVHRRRLEPSGVTFRSLRADPNTEFVRSTDTWFRPVNAINAPDGTIYIMDMAREIIESVHVPWDVVGKINLKSAGRGRIYRITPDGFQVPPPPWLSHATTAELVALLAHPGGWWRDTAQRLLRERQDKSVVAPLRAMTRSHELPLARLHALYALDQLHALITEDVAAALSDRHPGVREHAVRLAEPWLRQSNSGLANAVAALADDHDGRVRFQVAFALGEIGADSRPDLLKDRTGGLAAVAWHDADDPWLRTAILSSCADGAARVIKELLRRIAEDGEASARLDPLLEQLASLVGREKRDEAGRGAIDMLDSLAASHHAKTTDARRRPILLGLSDGLRGAGGSLQQLRPRLSHEAVEMIDRIVGAAMKAAADRSAEPGEQHQAIGLLSCGEFDRVSPTLVALLTPAEPEAVQRAAVQSLAAFDNLQVAAALLAPWRQYTPPVRDAVVQALFARQERLVDFIAAVEVGDVAVSHVGRVQRSILLAHRDRQVRARAEKLFETDTSPRSEIYDRYRPALTLAGRATEGEKVYERECMSCHQIGAKGQAVGPNLALTKNRTPEELLLHILDPNREVQPAFIQYTIVDRAGGIHTGLVTAETAASITLRRDKSVEETVLKQEIDEISSTEKSLMPEGFEKTIDQQQMADLLSFLGALHYDIGTQPGRRTADEGVKNAD